VLRKTFGVKWAKVPGSEESCIIRCFKIVIRQPDIVGHLSERTEEKHKEAQSGQSVFRQKIDPGTS
jgi:hypothetical protein